MVCDFGCGKKATHQFKNGRYCCSSNVNSCEAKKERDRAKKIGKNPFEGREHHKCRTGIKPWNYGLSKETDTRVESYANSISKFRKDNPSCGWTSQSSHSTKTKKSISRKMQNNGSGGYREGSGRGRKGWYKGVFCDSSWELAFVLWCEIKGRKVKRAKNKFSYEYNGETHKYLPDFRYKTRSGVWKYLEIKGYVSEQWKQKRKAFPHDLQVIGKRIMTSLILPTVIKHYGKDFIRLYEIRKSGRAADCDSLENC